MLNSFVIAASTALLSTYFSALTAYGIHTYDFRLKKIAFTFIMAVMVIPQQVSAVGFYQMCVRLGWTNSYIPLIVPGVAAPVVFFYMKQYIESVLPMEIIDSARVDGSGEFMTFNRIVLPMLKPALAVQLIFTFVQSWNNYFMPALLLDKAEDTAILNDYTQYTYKTEFSVNYDDPTVVNEYSAYQVIYPQLEYQTPEVMDYIQRDISRVERGLYSSDMVAGLYDYANELNVDSFVDYYILQEFLLNNDAFTHSTYLYRDVRGKLTIGPVWDYNNMLNNYIASFSSDGLYLANRGWYGQLMKDEAFVERVLDRYAQLRQGCLSDEYLLNYIDQVITYLGPAIARNDQVWGYSYDPEQLDNYQRRKPDSGQTLESVNPGSYQEAVDWMVSFLLERGAWLDENLESLRQYCHLSRNASEWME